MKNIIKIVLSLVMCFFLWGCQNQTEPNRTSTIQTQDHQETVEQDVTSKESKKISVTSNGQITIFELNDSQAANSLYEQLPLTIEVENYSDNEKIFYPPVDLTMTDAVSANAVTGTLAYYEPWTNVVMFYEDFGSASGLYELGQAISGSEYIEDMSGTIEIEAYLE